MNRNSSYNNFHNNSTYQASLQTNEESREVLLLRCKTTIDDLKDELERTEKTKDQLHNKFEALQKEYNIQERLLEEERSLNQGILDELNRIKGQVGMSINEQKELKQMISQKDKKILEQDVYIKTLCQKITIQDNIIQEYNNELGSKEQECSTLRQGQTESENYWAQSYNLLKISFNQKMSHVKEVEEKNKDLNKKIKELEKQIEDIKSSKQFQDEKNNEEKFKDDLRKIQKDHNEEVKKIKQESLEAYQEMQEIIKQHELQFGQLEKENIDLKLQIQQLNIELTKQKQDTNKIQNDLNKKNQEVEASNTIIKEQEQLMANFDNLISQKEQSIKEKYYLDLQSVRQQLIELQEQSNMKVVKDSSKVKEKYQQQILEREKKIKEYIDKFKIMEIKLDKKDQEIKMLNERIKLIANKKQKYKKKSIDLNTKYDVLDTQIRDLKNKMDQSFQVQEQQQQNINERNNHLKSLNDITSQSKVNLTTNVSENNKIPQYGNGQYMNQVASTQRENLGNLLKTQERNPLATLINNQKGLVNQQVNLPKNFDIKQTVNTERSLSTQGGNQSLQNIKEKLKASAEKLQKVINVEASSERPSYQIQQNQSTSTLTKAIPLQNNQIAINQLDQTNNTRLIEMKRKMMELEQAVKSKELENIILKDEIVNKKQKSQGDLTRKTRAVSYNNFN
ncbi:hypothetical protein TTHERM_00387130 (macronuclear) [Tetrahymena thermophila SB210]|uniref:Uncharacterized protein n=1 Tax=Tetrahymena thermophila (strain SB210) TaxID=312017 RepID=Q23RH7_TETTS|nr:hypothetical protein TTHERM_00387130 [Tetrahymena thermophila SB210]EAR99071.2 hypothetical protein TTHERM_00387130 [Tetrahymena thermophila SB210]|eukprot:XP_001019316.2 hypothetical protein TTHERM_00387130 [Tetrahymena thermophila SB210]